MIEIYVKRKIYILRMNYKLLDNLKLDHKPKGKQLTAFKAISYYS